MIFIGHRGSGANKIADTSYRENTLQSFHAALARGAAGLECDVRLSADGHLVLLHDPEIEGKKISEMTRSEILFYEPELATLEELLRSTSEKFLLDIEIKDPEAAIRAVTLLKGRKNFVVTSFLGEALERTKAANPDIRTGLIFGEYPGKVLREQLPSLRGSLRFADFIVVEQHYLSLFVRSKRPLWTWNTQTEKQVAKARAAEAEVAITDNPENFR